MQIRRIDKEDHRQVRELRLAALHDAPESFADSYEETEKKPTEYWVELTQSLCDEHVMFILEEDGEPVGSAYGLRDKKDQNTGRVAGMWVSSSFRGRGFGKALLQEVLKWAESCGFREMRLWAPAENPEVVKFYGSADFALTGVSQQVPTCPNLEIVEMRWKAAYNKKAQRS